MSSKLTIPPKNAAESGAVYFVPDAAVDNCSNDNLGKEERERLGAKDFVGEVARYLTEHALIENGSNLRCVKRRCKLDKENAAVS